MKIQINKTRGGLVITDLRTKQVVGVVPEVGDDADKKLGAEVRALLDKWYEEGHDKVVSVTGELMDDEDDDEDEPRSRRRPRRRRPVEDDDEDEDALTLEEAVGLGGAILESLRGRAGKLPSRHRGRAPKKKAEGDEE